MYSPTYSPLTRELKKKEERKGNRTDIRGYDFGPSADQAPGIQSSMTDKSYSYRFWRATFTSKNVPYCHTELSGIVNLTPENGM